MLTRFSAKRFADEIDIVVLNAPDDIFISISLRSDIACLAARENNYRRNVSEDFIGVWTRRIYV